MHSVSDLRAVSSSLIRAGIAAIRVAPDALSDLDAGKGAYVLLIELGEPTSIILPKKDEMPLTASTYLYVGSANGGGGMKARLARHFKKQKKIHWHVDQLTTRAAHVSALAVPDGNECLLGEVLINSGQFQVAVPGFGSSDCRLCASHLLVPVSR